MTKLTLTYVLIATVIFTSCKSKKDNKEIENTYEIAGIGDITMQTFDTANMQLSAISNTVEDNIVTLSISGLPNKVEYKFDSNPTTAPFNNSLRLTTNFAYKSTYPVTITATSDKYGSKDYSFNLILQEMSDGDCNKTLYNRIDINNKATHLINGNNNIVSEVNYNYQLQKNINSQTHKMYLGNLYLMDRDNAPCYTSANYNTPTDKQQQVEVIIKCTDGMIVLPTQQVIATNGSTTDTATISGTGEINIEKGTYHINYLAQIIKNHKQYLNRIRLSGAIKD